MDQNALHRALAQQQREQIYRDALQSVLDAFAPGDGRCVTVQTKQRVLNDVRTLLKGE